MLGISHPAVCRRRTFSQSRTLSAYVCSHSQVDTRDLALFLPFRSAVGTPNQVVGLPTLVWHFMRRKMTMETDSAEISRASMDLYRSHKGQWEGQCDS